MQQLAPLSTTPAPVQSAPFPAARPSIRQLCRLPSLGTMAPASGSSLSFHTAGSSPAGGSHRRKASKPKRASGAPHGSGNALVKAEEDQAEATSAARPTAAPRLKKAARKTKAPKRYRWGGGSGVQTGEEQPHVPHGAGQYISAGRRWRRPAPVHSASAACDHDTHLYPLSSHRNSIPV